MIAYLVHPYPKVRRASAEALFMVLGGLSWMEEQSTSLVEEVESLLTGSDWNSDLTLVKKFRYQLDALLFPFFLA